MTEKPKRPSLFGMTKMTPPAKRLIEERLSRVSMEPVEWLWPDRVPLGGLTILCGEPGGGKTTVMLDVIARSTIGGTWPNDEGTARQGFWLYITTENDTRRTVKPRLVAAGGDVNEVSVIKGTEVKDKKITERGFDLSQDLAEVEQRLKDGSTDQSAIGIVLDPLNEYLGEKVDSWRDSDVRRVLGPLMALAEKYQIACIGIMHPGKGEQQSSVMNKILGSKAFSGTARTIHFCVQEPEELKEEDDDDERFIFIQVKNNLGQKPKGLIYKIKGARVEAGVGDDPKRAARVGEMPFVSWLGTTDKSITDIFYPKKATGRDAERLDCVTWLNKRLGDGKHSVKLIEAEAKNDMGFKASILKYAREQLNVRTEPSGFGGEWVMLLPPRGKGAYDPIAQSPIDEPPADGAPPWGKDDSDPPAN
jgi:hypothetical protein